jgi:hypothetical protein
MSSRCFQNQKKKMLNQSSRTMRSRPIKDHLIPNVSKLKTRKEMFDALTRLYESKNTSRNLTLRHQLKNVTMNKSETIANYFMRISQIKD